MRLKNKKVLVTGGAKRLGKEIALLFAREGADVSICYNKSKKDAASVVKQIEELGRRACAVKIDVRNVNEIKNGVNRAAKFLGGIDILVNNAAVFQKGRLEDVVESEFDSLFDINLKAPLFFAKFALKFLRRSNCSRIINIADTYGFSPSAGFVPYGVSKAGLVAMAVGLAKELAPNVLINCVCPGVIAELAKGKRDNKAVSANLLKRAVKIADVLNAILFLAENHSMTGQTIRVDGGKNV